MPDDDQMHPTAQNLVQHLTDWAHGMPDETRALWCDWVQSVERRLGTGIEDDEGAKGGTVQQGGTVASAGTINVGGTTSVGDQLREVEQRAESGVDAGETEKQE